MAMRKEIRTDSSMWEMPEADVPWGAIKIDYKNPGCFVLSQTIENAPGIGIKKFYFERNQQKGCILTKDGKAKIKEFKNGIELHIPEAINLVRALLEVLEKNSVTLDDIIRGEKY